jgi:O-glycosyl hydrolase
MMWVVQNKLNVIEYHSKPGAMAGLYFGAQSMQQGFNFPPMNIGATRFLKDNL